MKIKVKEFVEGLYTKEPFINVKGDCIDLRAAEDYTFKAPQAGVQYQKNNEKLRDVSFDCQMIKLGIAMELPKGFSAIIKPRSSTTKKLKLVMATSGYIDNSYKGDADEWCFYCYALDNTTIHKGDRICQFMIIPNQFASIFDKIKWLFTNKITFEWVKSLSNNNRGGHGSTGVK